MGEFDGTGKVERPAGRRLSAREGRVGMEEEPGPHPLTPEKERDDAGVDRTLISRHLPDPSVDGRSDLLKELIKRHHGSSLLRRGRCTPLRHGERKKVWVDPSLR